MKRTKWNYEKVIIESLKYSTRIEFQQSKRSAYMWCYRNKKLNDISIFGHMVTPTPNRAKWNIENTLIEAKKYSSRKEFETNSAGAYKWARTNKVIDLVCEHMNKNFIEWDLSLVIEIAKKYSVRGKFIAENRGAYGWIVRNNHKKNSDIFGHMKKANKWNLEEVTKVAKLYKTRTEFQKSKHRTAYIWCHRNDELDNDLIFGHMGSAKSGFCVDKPAILYYLKLFNGEGYKIGITNRTILDRFCKDDLSNIEVLSIIDFARGIDAKKEETRILKQYIEYKYSNCNLLKSGNTEIFTTDVLNLDINKEQ